MVNRNFVQNVCEIYKDKNVGRVLILCLPSFEKVTESDPKAADRAHHSL